MVLMVLKSLAVGSPSTDPESMYHLVSHRKTCTWVSNLTPKFISLSWHPRLPFKEPKGPRIRLRIGVKLDHHSYHSSIIAYL